MKKLIAIYQSYMLRPMVYKAFARFMIALVPALLWNRFINQQALFSLRVHGLFVIGAFLLAMAWFNFLSLDGLGLQHLRQVEHKPKRKKHWHKDLVDFVDEKIISFDELERDEQTLCNLVVNLFVGTLFVGMSLFQPRA